MSFESKTRQGVFHTMTIGDDNVPMQCTCEGWLYSKADPKECRHTKEFNKSQATGKPISKTLTNVAGTPVQPMLASSLPEGMSVDDFDSSTHVLEEKFDGHRLILEVNDDGSYRAWSRSGNARIIPEHLTKFFKWLPPRILLDGELYIPGDTSTSVTDLGKLGKLRIAFFDVLRCDGTSTLDLRGSDRRKLLELATSEIAETNVLHIAEQSEPSAAGLNEIWARSGEGAILKRRDAIYAPGKRSRDWVKLKHFEPLVLTIIGYEAGSLGPYAKVLLADENGTPVTSVKTVNDDWRARIAANPNFYLNRRLQIECQGRAANGGVKSPMWDRMLEESEA
jgi:bifunctional non-homologous end joining protein LigD